MDLGQRSLGRPTAARSYVDRRSLASHDRRLGVDTGALGVDPLSSFGAAEYTKYAEF
jgi:hypothetical protein